MKKKNTHKVIWITLGLMLFFVVQDLLGFFMWSNSGGYSGEAYQSVGMSYFYQFWLFAYVSILAVAGTYYLLTKDWTETIALVTTPIILLWFGVHDLMYWLTGLVPFTSADGAYLYNHMPVVALFADLFNGGVVNIGVFAISSFVGSLVAYFVYKELVKR